MARVEVEFDGVSRGAVNAARQTRTAIRGIADESDRTGRRSSLMGNLITYSIKRAAFAGGVGLTTLAAGVGFLGFRFDNLKQQAGIAFSTMLGSGKRAQAFLNELQKFAARTPFEFPDLIRASQRLLAMGFSAKQVVPTLTAVGNAVAGLGGDPVAMDATIRAIGQIQAKGRLMAEEMMQLNEAGTFSWKALAFEIGKSVPDAMNLVTKGAITSDIFLEAFARNSERRFHGMMDRQSQTFGGLLSTLKDMFNQFAGIAMQPLFDLATRGMKAIVNSNGEVQASARRTAHEFGVTLANAVAGVVNWVRTNWPEIRRLVSDTASAVRDVAGVLRTVAREANRVSLSIGGWDESFKLILAGVLASRLSRIVLVLRDVRRAFATTAVVGVASEAAVATGAEVASKRIRFAMARTGVGLLILAAAEIILHWKQVSAFFLNFRARLKKIFDVAWLSIEIGAVNAALRVIDAFSHLPGRLGGWARRAKGAMQDELDSLEWRRTLIQIGGQAGDLYGKAFAQAANRAMATPGVEPGSRGGGGGARGLTPRGRGGARITSVATQAAAAPGAGSTGFHLPGERKPYDCSAFVQAVYRSAGVSIGSTTYSQVKQGQHVNRADLQPGDLIFMNFPGERSPGHVGIYIGGGEMVHDHGAHGGVQRQAVPWNAVVDTRTYVAHGGPAVTPGPDVGSGVDLGGDIPVGAGTGADADGAKKKRAAGRGRAGPALPDAGERRRDLLGIRWLQTNLGRIAPQLRARIRREMSGIAEAIRDAKTEQELAKATTRLEKLKDRFNKALQLTSAITTVRKSTRAIATELARLPESMRGDLERRMEHIRTALTKVTTQRGLAKLRSELEKIQDAIKAAIEKMTAAVDDATGAFESAWGRLGDKLLAVFDAQTQKLLDNARAFVAEFGFTIGVGEETPTERALRERTAGQAAQDEQDRIADLQNQINAAQDAEERDRLQKELNRAMFDAETRRLELQAERERKAADEALAAEQRQIQDARDAMREKFIDRLGAIEKDIVAGKLTAEQAQKAIADAMVEAGLDPQTAAELIGPAFMATLTAAINDTTKAIGDLIDAIRLLAQALGTQVPAGESPPPPYGQMGGGPIRFAGGGRVPGHYIGRDSIPALLMPGEEVIDRSLSRELRGYLSRGRISGGRIGPVYVLGTTQREVERALAKLVEPHLDETISYRNER